MFVSVQTIYSRELQTHKLLNRQYTPKPNTTLNEKYNIGNRALIGNPDINTIMIGVKPDNYFDDNTHNFLDLKHSATDGVVYKPIPFIMRETTSDINSEEAKRFRLRVLEVHNNTEYICYYGMKIDTESGESKLYRIIREENSRYGMFEYDIRKKNVLNPQVIPATPYNQFKANEYLIDVIEIEISLTVPDLLEVENSMDIIYPDSEKVISEIGVLSSIDDGVEINSAQTNFFLSTQIITNDVISNGKPYLASIPLGGMEMNMFRGD
jgi:hypothetical protein